MIENLSMKLSEKNIFKKSVIFMHLLTVYTINQQFISTSNSKIILRQTFYALIFFGLLSEVFHAYIFEHMHEYMHKI